MVPDAGFDGDPAPRAAASPGGSPSTTWAPLPVCSPRWSRRLPCWAGVRPAVVIASAVTPAWPAPWPRWCGGSRWSSPSRTQCRAWPIGWPAGSRPPARCRSRVRRSGGPSSPETRCGARSLLPTGVLPAGRRLAPPWVCPLIVSSWPSRADRSGPGGSTQAVTRLAALWAGRSGVAIRHVLGERDFGAPDLAAPAPVRGGLIYQQVRVRGPDGPAALGRRRGRAAGRGQHRGRADRGRRARRSWFPCRARPATTRPPTPAGWRRPGPPCSYRTRSSTPAGSGLSSTASSRTRRPGTPWALPPGPLGRPEAAVDGGAFWPRTTPVAEAPMPALPGRLRPNRTRAGPGPARTGSARPVPAPRRPHRRDRRRRA